MARSRPRNAGDRQRISDGRRRPGESVYRHPAWLDHQSAIVGAIFGLMGLLFVVMVLVGAVTDLGESDTFLNWAVTTVLVAPITLSAVLGALTLNRWGWIVALVFGAGFELVVVGSVGEDHTLVVWGGVTLVVGVAGFFVLGHIRRVPMWIGNRFTGTREVSDGWLPGESEPGVLAREDDAEGGRAAR